MACTAWVALANQNTRLGSNLVSGRGQGHVRVGNEVSRDALSLPRSLVFRMVEAEEEYMEQMEVLVSCFLRPFKMAASSKKPPCSHEDVNSIFLNTETVLFLHQIFLKGLTSRMESWPTLVLGEFVRHARGSDVRPRDSQRDRRTGAVSAG